MRHILPNRFAILAMVFATFSCTFVAQAEEKAKPQKDRGIILSVDIENNTLVLNKKKGEKTMTLSPEVRVKPKSVGGVKGLKPGMYIICYTIQGEEVVSAIRHKPEQDQPVEPVE